MNKPFFTVMVPVYNAEKYLDECFNSIITQDFEDFEVVLIDDGSTDNSGAMCDAYANKHHNVYVQHIENSGEIGARRACIAAAKGEWLCFVDADDYYFPGSLRKFYEVIQNYDTDMVIGRLGENYSQPRTIEEYRQWLFSGEKFHPGVIATAVRSDLYNEDVLDIPRTVKKGPDFIINIRLSFRTNKVPRILDELIYFYRSTPTSIIANNPPSIPLAKLFKEHLKKSFPEGEYKKYLPFIVANAERDITRMAYARTLPKNWQDDPLIQEWLQEAQSINYQFGWRVATLFKIRSPFLHNSFVNIWRIINRIQALFSR